MVEPSGNGTNGTELLFVRHGQAQSFVDGIIGGRLGCSGLSALGRQQAEALRDRFAAAGERADVVLSSTLPRAVETADIVAVAFPGAPRRSMAELCELHPGEVDGTPYEDYRRGHEFDMLAEPDRPFSPGGESLAVFRDRVGRAFDRLVDEFDGRRVIVVCHGGVIVSVTRKLLGTSVTAPAPYHLVVENTALTEWRRHDDRWALARHNDAAHLDGLSVEADPSR